MNRVGSCYPFFKKRTERKSVFYDFFFIHHCENKTTQNNKKSMPYGYTNFMYMNQKNHYCKDETQRR